MATRASALLRGVPTTYDRGGEYAGNDCSVDHIADPDNLAYLPEYQVLFVGEDTRAQLNDSVWAYDLREESLTRLLMAPYGAENTSIHVYPDLNGWAYLKTVIHAPFGEPGLPPAETDEERQAPDGTLGPLPAL